MFFGKIFYIFDFKILVMHSILRLPTITLLFIFISSLQLKAQCLDFNVEESSGNDVCNARWNGIEICEDEQKIKIGTKTVYIVRSNQNTYGDWVYSIQEAKGYGWPEVGYVKVASTMDIIEVKFLAAVARYSVESPYEKAERERQYQKSLQEEQSRKLASDKATYPSIDQALNSKNLSLSKQLIEKLNSPSSYPRYSEYNEMVQKNNLESDSKKYNIILSKINAGDFNSARIDIRGLNYPNKFPYNSEMQKKEDEFLKVKISSLISQSKLEEAVENYDLLNLQESKTSLHSDLKTSLINYYKSLEQPLSNEQLTKIINENKQVFAKMSIGEYKINSDSDGNLSMNGQSIGVKMTPLSKSIGKTNSFTINTCAIGTVKIGKTINNDGPEKILVSTKKSVYQTKKDKLYKKVFLSGPGYFNLGNHIEVGTTYMSEIPKNTYKTVQPVIVQKTANGILTEEKKDNQVKSEGKFKNRALTVTFRTVSLAIYGGLIYLLL